MDILEIMEARHSVRQYTDAPIEEEKREVLDALCASLNEKSGLHMQIIYDEPKCFQSMLAHYGKFENVRNYIAVVGKKDPELDEAAGYYGEQLVLKAQELGLNTCWVALTHGKSAAVIEKGEKQVIIIALGYGTAQGTPHKGKTAAQVSDPAVSAMQWYQRGVQAALLAPTAMNQQKFMIRLRGNTAEITAKGGILTKVDLGIVRYHFEAASGHEVNV